MSAYVLKNVRRINSADSLNLGKLSLLKGRVGYGDYFSFYFIHFILFKFSMTYISFISIFHLTKKLKKNT